MTRKTATSILSWIILLMGFWGLSLFGDSKLAFFCLVLWFLLPIVSFLLNLRARQNISADVQVIPTMSKNSPVQGRLIIKNSGVIPVSRVYCRVQVINHLTKEKSELLLELKAVSKGKVQKEFQIASAHCGYLYVSVEKIDLMDWMGFLPVSCRAQTPGQALGKVSVLPDTFSSGIYLSMSMARRDDAESWSQDHRGNDYTEVFALRDYVEGDSLKQIHWKLSSKRQQLIVKEPSLPIEKSLLIFWDKNAAAAAPEEMDAMAECVASIGQEILGQGISFTLGWTEGKNNAFEAIDAEEQLIQAIPRMLKWGADLSSGSGAFLYAQSGLRNLYAKTIYVAGTYPEDFEPLSDGDMTLVLCDREMDRAMWPLVTFGAETYRTDLETIEL